MTPLTGFRATLIFVERQATVKHYTHCESATLQSMHCLTFGGDSLRGASIASVAGILAPICHYTPRVLYDMEVQWS